MENGIKDMELMESAQMAYASNGHTHAVEGFTHIKEYEYLEKSRQREPVF